MSGPTMDRTLTFVYVKGDGDDQFAPGHPGPRPGPVRRGGADGGVRIGGKLLRTVGRPADKWLRIRPMR